MIWSIFKNCRKNKSKPEKSNNSSLMEDPKKILQELLPKLDVLNDLSACGDNVYLLDQHFEYLSVVDPYHEVKESISEITDQDVHKMNSSNDSLEDTLIINNRCTKVTEKLLNSLQCPFTWNFEANVWNKNVTNRIENKYGKFNMDISAKKFSIEKYTSYLIIGCELYKTNAVDKAHDKLIRVWEWLDKLDNSDDTFYLSIREGLKHLMMSTLCHILYSVDRYECRQVFEMISLFNNLNSKSKAAVYAIRAAFCIEIGGKELENVIQYAKKACDLDPDTAHWHYFHSLAMTAQRQYLHTNKSCPTETEFDAVQHAIILTNEPNAYFNFHRMNLMTNKILSHHFNSGNIICNKNEKSFEIMKQNLCSIVELIKAIIAIESGNPHLVVRCAKSLITMPYLSQDDVYLVRQIITIAVDMANNDSTVIRAIEKIIDIAKELVNIYKTMNANMINLESTLHTRHQTTNNDKGHNLKNALDNEEDNLENNSSNKDPNLVNDVDVKEHNLENIPGDKEREFNNDLKLIVQKNKKGSKPVLDLIQLLEKYDGNYRWKIMAQICSYSILFKDSTNFLVGVEQFLMLIHDRTIANSDIVKNHRSIFIKDDSKIFNLAELVCNEIKLFLIQGCIKNQDQIQFCLDQLTKIMEVCQIKSKNADPSFKSELIGREQEKQENVLNEKNVFNQKNKVQSSKQIASKKKSSKPRRIKQAENSNSSKNHTRVIKSYSRIRRNNIVA